MLTSYLVTTIKRKSIVNKLEDGGLNMIDLRSHISAIKAAWAARIVTAPANHVWSFLPKLYLSRYGEDWQPSSPSPRVASSTILSIRLSLPSFRPLLLASFKSSFTTPPRGSGSPHSSTHSLLHSGFQDSPRFCLITYLYFATYFVSELPHTKPN